MDITPSSVTADNYFAIIPEWVLFSGVSANAIRLYCVLNRHANKKGECFPTRKTLSQEMNGVSEKTTDRAMDELSAIGAIIVFHRKNGEEYTSNLYQVVTTNPRGVGTPVPPRPPTDVEQTKAIEPKPLKDIQVDKVAQSLAAFETFWEAYPRKDGRKNSTTAFNRALKVATLAEILAGVERLKAEKRDPKFIPLASSWLNGERWTDEGANPVTEVITPTKIPPRLTSDEFSNPSAVPMPDYVKKSLKRAYSDEIEFP